MKIILVISYFYPAWSYGGPGKLVYDLSEGLVKEKNSVSVFSTDVFNAVRRRKKTDNINLKKNTRIKYFFYPNLSNKLAFNSKIFLTCMNFIRLIKEIKECDVIHIHEFFTPLAAVTSKIAKRRNKPYLISAHGTLDSFHLSHRKNFKGIFMRLFGNKMLKNAEGLIAATKEEISEYQGLGIPINKIFLVHNGIDFAPYKKMPSHGYFRKKYKIKQDTLILVYLGRINWLKGLDLLIEAFSELELIERAKLVIAGSDDGYLKPLKILVSRLNLEEKVIFPGIMSGVDKLKMYSDSDLFIYPSPAEGFSIAVLEAGASGLPLVITAGCKFPEVDRSGCGITVAFKKDAFVKAINNLLSDKILREKMGRNARNLVKDDYTIKTMADKLIKVYKKIHDQR